MNDITVKERAENEKKVSQKYKVQTVTSWSKWSQMVAIGPNWSWPVANDCKQSQTIGNDQNWSQVITNVCKQLQTVADGHKRKCSKCSKCSKHSKCFKCSICFKCPKYSHCFNVQKFPDVLNVSNVPNGPYVAKSRCPNFTVTWKITVVSSWAVRFLTFFGK